MKQLMFLQLMILPLFINAQTDSVSILGVISNISINSGSTNNESFEVKVNVFSLITGKADSTVVFYIHSPAKQLLITDYTRPETYRDNVYFFKLKKDDGRTFLLSDAYSANILKGKCTVCDKPIQGFMFGNKSFSHYIYCCPQHGKINEEWEDYE